MLLYVPNNKVQVKIYEKVPNNFWKLISAYNVTIS